MASSSPSQKLKEKIGLGASPCNASCVSGEMSDEHIKLNNNCQEARLVVWRNEFYESSCLHLNFGRLTFRDY